MHVNLVDREKGIPLYIQLASSWREQIRTGNLRPGEQLPTEKELVKLHDVSRITVSKAVHTLVNEGLLVTQQGKGTFVNTQKLRWDLSRLSSFSDDMRSRGFVPGAKILRKEICRGVVEQIGLLDEDSLAIRVERLRLANNEPMAIEVVTLSYELFAPIYDSIVEDTSLYTLMAEKTGIKLAYGTQLIESSLPSKAEKQILQIKGDLTVLRLERIAYSTAGNAIEYTKSAYRGDKYSFKVTLRC